MLHVQQFVEEIITPALDAIGLNSRAARELLLGTALQESNLFYLKQIHGPAMGLFQMEPATHDDLWTNYLIYKPKLAGKVHTISCQQTPEEMAGNLWYGAAMCRIHYLRVKAALPKAGNIKAQAAYWKKYYNTHLGKGTVEEYIDNWNRQ